MSDLQRDMHLVDLAFGIAFDDNDPSAEAWQRLKPRLTPNRERVARAIRDVMDAHGWETCASDKPALLQAAEAAIKAMEGNDDA